MANIYYKTTKKKIYTQYVIRGYNICDACHELLLGGGETCIPGLTYLYVLYIYIYLLSRLLELNARCVCVLTDITNTDHRHVY